MGMFLRKEVLLVACVVLVNMHLEELHVLYVLLVNTMIKTARHHVLTVLQVHIPVVEQVDVLLVLLVLSAMQVQPHVVHVQVVNMLVLVLQLVLIARPVLIMLIRNKEHVQAVL
jgi:hypothetical protein